MVESAVFGLPPAFVENVLSNIVAGAVGGLAVAIATLLFRLVRNKIIYLKYPIHGRYITYYEDIVDGAPVILTSETCIKQRGKNIFGENVTFDGRKWNLDGKISGNGHVSGVYSADRHYDEGVGAFYLKFSGDRLDGIWSGYDHDNKMTASGRYWFKKIPKISITEYRKPHRAAVLAIAAENFGAGYLQDLSAFIETPEGFLLVAMSRGRIVGFVAGKNGDGEEIVARMAAVPHEVRLAQADNAVGVIKTIAVTPELQGCGIGVRLTQAAERRLARLGAEIILFPAWKSGNAINAEGILKLLKYKEIETLEGYWKKACDRGDFVCPTRQDQCRCAMVVYRKADAAGRPGIAGLSLFKSPS